MSGLDAPYGGYRVPTGIQTSPTENTPMPPTPGYEVPLSGDFQRHISDIDALAHPTSDLHIAKPGYADAQIATGMSLRDQFAMSAPEVPEWFMAQALAQMQGMTGHYYGPPRSPYEPRTLEQQSARYFAWRWHYADEMMRTRGKS